MNNRCNKYSFYPSIPLRFKRWCLYVEREINAYPLTVRSKVQDVKLLAQVQAATMEKQQAPEWREGKHRQSGVSVSSWTGGSTFIKL